MKRDINDVREIHMIPYCHTDYAWCNIRSWHICRYIASYEQMLMKMRENSEYTGTLDNIVHSLAIFLRYRPELADELVQRVREGRIAVVNGGWSLARPSQVGEETYLRNMMASDEKFRELFGEDLQIDCLFNADTSCGHPQMPQIVRLMGYDSYCFQRPEQYLNKMGIPKEFVWEGIDGSKVTVSRGIYGGLFMGDYLEQPPTDDRWDEVYAGYNTYELDEHLNLLPSPVMVQFVGCDDTLPDYNIRDRFIYVDQFIEQWNKKEKPKMFYSTLNRVFEALKKENLPAVKGDIDPYDLTYNVPKKGNNSFWYARYKGERLLTEIEATASIAAVYGIPYPEEKIDALWKSLFEFTGHAMEYILREDIPDLTDIIKTTLHSASKLLRDLKQTIADAVCGMEENAYAVINTTATPLCQTVNFALTATGGIYDFTLEDEAGNPIDFCVIDYAGGDKPYEDAKYSSCIAAADLTVAPYSVKKLRAVRTGKKRDHLTAEERTNMLTAYNSEHLDPTDFTIHAGGIEYVFEGRELMEIKRGGEIIRTGRPLAELCFNATVPTVDWLYHTGVVTRHVFMPEHAYRLTESSVYTSYRMEGKLNGRDVTLKLSAGSDGILHFEPSIFGDYEAGYYALEFDTDASKILTCDIHFGTRKLDFNGITAEHPMFDDWGEVETRGGFQAKSYVSFSTPAPMAAFGIDTASYWKYDLTENRVCLMLTAQFDMDPEPDTPRTGHRWESFLDREAFGCEGKHSFHAAILPFECDLAKLAVTSLALKHPMEAKKGFSSKMQAVASPAIEIAGNGIVVTAYRRVGEECELRFYETRGEHTAAVLHTEKNSSAYKCDLRGRIIEALDVTDGKIDVDVKPYEIITIRMK
ncbi:MAG: hypothetical protein IJA85_09765 [Clostridia bacterium]|nr:hypothetical protein [Clostridia bacterium]